MDTIKAVDAAERQEVISHSLSHRHVALSLSPAFPSDPLAHLHVAAEREELEEALRVVLRTIPPAKVDQKGRNKV